MQHWEGLARFEDASTLAAAHGGTARRVATAVATAVAPTERTGIAEAAE